MHEITRLIRQIGHAAGSGTVDLHCSYEGRPVARLSYVTDKEGKWPARGTAADRITVTRDTEYPWASITVTGDPDEDPTDLLRELLDVITRTPLAETAVAL